ncbi:hypothetical protein PpBr36_04277 [Pyricularia pennisetigena]|uniref:hypothetical protein n=1 Tax=Pyricularia pennisetigena TaxID=1578925 RepID=UPI0011533D51|nr:hypothetical protein PpBr36_04277 [Pyricularia pennisetigena]TLS27308.1 hypothetical protein PpBr36_04277 [Pyricularia pennisetigena]
MQLVRVVATLSAFTSVSAAPGIATSFIRGLVPAKLYSGDSSNQLTDGTPCRAITIIYARGTTQSGNIGNSKSVGPITFDALAKIVGPNRLAVQGVDYKASFLGYAEGGQPKATDKMVELVKLAQTKCPASKVFVVGYSQGAQVAHNVVNALPAITAARITGILTFGDPDALQPVRTETLGKWKIICHDDDRLCAGSHIHVTLDHLNYQTDAKMAAEWIAAKAGMLPKWRGTGAPDALASGMGAPNLAAPNLAAPNLAASGGIAAAAAK